MRVTASGEARSTVTMKDRALQELLDETATTLGVVGAQLAVFDGRVLREFVTGSRNLELDLPVTRDTLFQIGSTTKVFNAALVLSLVDERRLDLDRPVIDYVPELRLASLEAQHKVTLRHLLSMTGGLDNGTYHDYGRGDDALVHYVTALAGVPQLFAPGAAFGYSNASTNVSGHAASRVTGRSWERLLTERILEPLQLKHAAIFAEDLLSHPVSLGYKRDSADAPIERVRDWALPRSMGPAGGTLCMSAGDLVRFGRMFLDRGRSEATGAQVLSEAAIAEMQTPQVQLLTRLLADEWCVGPYRKSWDGVALYGHSGTNVGGSSMLLWCPERNFAIATLVNVPDQGYPLAARIFDRVFPEMFGIKKPLSPDPDSVPAAACEVDKYVGRYEALGITIHISQRNGALYAVEDNDVARLHDTAPVIETELLPLGADRFLPRNPASSGNRLWDVAFWDGTGKGRPTHLLNGLFAYRRTA
jgi:CubicO group peptidase (beta-lactamase class C family)